MQLNNAETKLITALKAGKPCGFEKSPLATVKRQDGEDREAYEKRLAGALKKEPPADKAARTLRAGVLGKILRGEALGAGETPVPLPRQLTIGGAHIQRELDITLASLPVWLGLMHCDFEGKFNAMQCRFDKGLCLNGSRFAAGIDLMGATIGGQFTANGAHFINPDGDAFMAQGAEIKWGVFLTGAMCKGQVSFSGATIGGQFTANGAHFINRTDFALLAQGAKVEGDVFLTEAECQGEVSFAGATIGGQFGAERAHFINPKKEGHALMAQEAEIKLSVFLTGAMCKGEIRFAGATIGRLFNAEEAHFINPDGDALTLERADIKGYVILRGAKCQGKVNFLSSHIGGQLSVTNASLFNLNGNVFIAESAVIRGGFIARNLQHVPVGGVSLALADISTLAIDASFWPSGQLERQGLVCKEIKYEGENRPSSSARLWQGWLARPPETDKNRKMACEKACEKACEILEWDKVKWDEREAKFRKKHWQDFHPEAWIKYIHYLRTRGDGQAANRIHVEMERRQTVKNVRDRQNRLSASNDIAAGQTGKNCLYGFWAAIKFGLWLWGYGVWRWLFDLCSGYGIKPWRALVGLFVLLIFSTWVFNYFESAMKPAQARFYLSSAYPAYQVAGTLPPNYPEFSPLIYSLDVMIPVIDLAQESHWRPQNTDGINWLRWYNRLHLILGWFFSTIALLGFTGLIQRKDV